MLDSALRRQEKIRNLHKQFYYLSEKLQKVEMEYHAENDTLARLKLEWHIREIKERRETIEQDLEKLEQIDAALLLYQALSKLNYHAQMNVFLRLLKHSKVGAFLIHGAADHGQRWLLNRLMGHAIRTSDDLVLPISFGYWDRRDLSVILQKIGERLNLRRNSSLQEIIEHLHACWQKRSVILIFRDAGDVPPPLLRDLKEQFWDVLVQRTRRGPSPQEQARLLLFLVDEAGNVGEWPFSCAEQPDASWSPDVPVKPPMITPIGVADLTTWMQIVCEDLPAKIRDTPAQIIWQQAREGIPQLVLEHLCELGNCEWLEMEHVWMKY